MIRFFYKLMYLSKCILEHFSKEPVPRLHQTVQGVHGRKKVKNMGEGKRGAAEDKGVSRQGGQGQSHTLCPLEPM